MSRLTFGTFKDEMGSYLEAIVMSLPGRLGNRTREWYLGRRFASSAGRFYVARGCVIYGPGSISIGRNFRCGRNCLLSAEGGSLTIGDHVSLNTNVHVNASVGGSIRIGNDVRIGPNVVLRSANHTFSGIDVPISHQGHDCGDIVVEDDVWLGANIVVLMNVKIGRGAVIGAGAVVSRDIPPMTIAVGIPARPVGSRGSTESTM